MASADNIDDHHSAGSFPADPMHQFEISRYFELGIGGLDISFTNYLNNMMRITLLIFLWLTLYTIIKNG